MGQTYWAVTSYSYLGLTLVHTLYSKWTAPIVPVLKVWPKLYMANAYLQLPLDEESKEFVVINTHKGVFKYNRLPFGISSVPQRSMDTLLQGMKGISVYLDDVLLVLP